MPLRRQLQPPHKRLSRLRVPLHASLWLGLLILPQIRG
jgi:hypothetical protein